MCCRREPDFHEHRMLRTPERDVHLHVLSRGSAEIERSSDVPRPAAAGTVGSAAGYEEPSGRLRRRHGRIWMPMPSKGRSRREHIAAARAAGEVSR